MKSGLIASFYSSEWEDIARKGVLSYGVTIGLLNKIAKLPINFSYSGIYLSYPHTTEIVKYIDSSGNTVYIDISTDSQRDSNTRTMSRLIGWCVTVGLIEPQDVSTNDSPLAHIKYRDFVNSEILTVRNYKKTDHYINLFNSKPYVSNPLSYSRLHKNVASLRENGGEDLRNATLEYNNNILNRRFVFVYTLNYYSKLNKALDFEKLVTAMSKYSDEFFSEDNDPTTLMESESDIADIVGIPFDIDDHGMLIPKTTINDDILSEDAPKESIALAKKVIKEMEAN